MTIYSLTLQESHREILLNHLIHTDGNERVAYILCKHAEISMDPWCNKSHIKFLSYEIMLVPDEELIESSPDKVTWSTTSFIKALKVAQKLDATICIIHNHPSELSHFSSIDDLNEPDLLALAKNRNGKDTKLISLIITSDNNIIGRIWLSSKNFEQLGLIRTIGSKRIRIEYPDRGQGVNNLIFNRQALAFGEALNQDLSMLRIGIIGCGATGSAAATLLARIGVGKLLLIDKDIVEHTNLNRLHGARKSDADLMRSKVDVLSNSITGMGLGTKVSRIKQWVGAEECRYALKACDIIFSCTDDHEGRMLLNRFAYYYLVPVFDLGLFINLTKTEPPSIESLDGRVTVIAPNHTCLVCRGVVNTRRAYEEWLKRTDPREYSQRKKEAYVIGEGNPSPAVITFTTEVATMAVNELIHRFQGFRGEDGSTNQRTRFFHLMKDIRPGDKPKEGCILCDKKDRWGMGDTLPFLGRI